MRKPFVQKSCVVCGAQFETRKEKQVYCRPACRYRSYQDAHVSISVDEYRDYGRLKELAFSAGLVP